MKLSMALKLRTGLLPVALVCSLAGPANAQLVSTATLAGAGGTALGGQGQSVSLSANGNTAVVGGPADSADKGAAWVFTRSGGAWIAGGVKLLYGTGGSTGATQGSAVAISGDASTILVGGVQDSTNGASSGGVWMYSLSGATYVQQGSFLGASSSELGSSVALSADGNTALVGARTTNSGSGAVSVFTRSAGTWSFATSLTAPGTGFLGNAVALSADANTAIAGAPGIGNAAGAAWVFTRSGTTWSAGTKLPLGTPAISSGQQGTSVGISQNGQSAIVGGVNNSQNGAAWIYALSNGSWTQQAKLVSVTEAGSAQGSSVALSGDGNTALVGGPFSGDFSGTAWEFTRTTPAAPAAQIPKWSQVAELDGDVTSFAGAAVALSASGNVALSGAPDGGTRGVVYAYGAPDLAITNVHNGTFTRGQAGAAYTIHLSNVGDAPTTGTVTVADRIPTGLTATGISGSGWTGCTIATVNAVTTASCNRSTVLAAGTAYPDITLNVNVAQSAPAAIGNISTVSGGGETNAGNNTSTDLVTLPQVADLAITNTHAGAFAPGAVVTITLIVQNAGTASTGAALVTVSNPLPIGLNSPTITSSPGWSPCAVAGNILTCSRSSALAGGASYPAIAYTAAVGGAVGALISNTATVSCACDTNASNDSSNDTGTLTGPGPDLTIAMGHGRNFTRGVNNSWTLTVKNTGSAPTSSLAANGQVTVVDTLPPGVTLASMSGTGWTCATFLATCVRSDALAAGASYQPIRVTVKAASTGNVTNTASVSGGGDINTANNSASDITMVN